MYLFKKEFKNEILQGRTARYVANNIIDVHEFYLSNILNGKMGCSKRLAKDIVRCANKDAQISDYFTIKEK